MSVSGRCQFVLALAVILVTGCQTAPQGQPSTPPSGSATGLAGGLPTPTLVTITSEHPVLRLGPFGVGNLACNGQTMAFSTSSAPRQSRNDLIKVAGMDGSNVHVVARATHGGTLTDAVPVSADWVVFLEYAQAGQGASANFWYLNAASLRDGHLVGLASATAPPGALELPTYAVSGNQVLWAQVAPDGSQALLTQDLAVGARSQVPLPAYMRPFSPSIAGSTVVFIDDETSAPASADVQHGGSLQRIDLGSASIRSLERPVVYAPVTNGKTVIWTTDAQDPLHPGPNLVWSPVIGSIDGGQPRRLAAVGDLTLLSDEFAAWPDHETRDIFAYRMNSGRLAEIRVAGRDDLRAVLALCGSTLLYALPPEVDGDQSVIRSIYLAHILPG